MDVIEQELQVRTPDGKADSILYRVTERGKPGVIVLPDGIGFRDSQKDMAHRVASWGYNVLLPNIYYRSGKPPFFPPKPDLADEKTSARFKELTGRLNPEAMVRDGSAYVDFLGTREGIAPGPMGIVGFCFTGQFALRVAAARPDRITAAAAFHGGRLYLDEPASPHLVLPKVKARLYFGHAREDRTMPAETIARFEESLAAWGGRFESDTYNARHGWTVPDSAAYDEAEAERAMLKLRAFLADAIPTPSGSRA